MLDSLRPKNRDLTDAGKMIIGGAFAAIAYEGYRLFTANYSNSFEWVIGAVLSGILFMALSYVAALSFRQLEKETPQPEVNLTEEALADIENRLDDCEDTE